MYANPPIIEKNPIVARRTDITILNGKRILLTIMNNPASIPIIDTVIPSMTFSKAVKCGKTEYF